jgi:hypothetical protein
MINKINHKFYYNSKNLKNFNNYNKFNNKAKIIQIYTMK